MESKINLYNNVINSLRAFYEKNTFYSLSNIAKYCLISTAIKRALTDFAFVGFYIVKNDEKQSILEIGPYSSNILPVPVILFGNGVCGTCWEEKQSIIINDVKNCKNYIACDSKVQSEIVVPVFDKEKKELIAVLDIDSNKANIFDDIDKEFLEKIVDFIYLDTKIKAKL